MKYENYIQLEFPSKSCNEALARSVAGVFASQMDPTMEELGDIKTAVSEAVTNCIVHAYPDCIGKILMRCRYTTGGEERSGMGFTIMESFMDKLTVRSTPGEGTSVIMLRTLPRRVRDR